MWFDNILGWAIEGQRCQCGGVRIHSIRSADALTRPTGRRPTAPRGGQWFSEQADAVLTEMIKKFRQAEFDEIPYIPSPVLDNTNWMEWSHDDDEWSVCPNKADC